MPYANGRFPTSALASIPGSSPRAGGRPLLRRDAAAAYNALHAYALKRWGISMAISEGAVRRAYREYAAQLAAKATYGSNAATPGYSNHGLAIAVDLLNRTQRWVMDQVGKLFGFSKSWSDAAWEWWHIRFQTGHWKGVAKFVSLRYRSHGSRVAWLQRRLRAKGFRSVAAPGKPGYGFFGEATLSAVKRFQKAHHLTADGVVGPATWNKLAL